MQIRDIIQFLYKSVGLIGIFGIAHNTGRISQKIDSFEKKFSDHESRIREIEPIKNTLEYYEKRIEKLEEM